MPRGLCRFRVSNIESSVTFNEFRVALKDLALDDVIVDPDSLREDPGTGFNMATIRLTPDEADILRGPMKEAKVFVDRSGHASKGITMELKFTEIKQPKEAAGEQASPTKVQLAEPADPSVAKEAERLDKALTPRPRDEKPKREGEDSASPTVGHSDLPKASIMMEPEPRMAPQREAPEHEMRPPRPAMEDPELTDRQRPQGYPPVDSSSLGRQRPRFDPPEESPQRRSPAFPPPEQGSQEQRGLGRGRQSYAGDQAAQDRGMYRDEPWQDGSHINQAGQGAGVYREQPWQDPGHRRDQTGQDVRASTPSSEQGEYFSHCSRMLETVDGQPKLLRSCVAQAANCVVS